MAKENKAPDPKREQVAAAGEEALQQILGQPGILKELLADLTPDDVVMNHPETRYRKASQNRSGCWVHGPALVELFAAAEESLRRASAERGRPTREVTRVRAVHIARKKLVFIWPTHDDDPEGISPTRPSKMLRINLSSLLAPSGQRVEAGYRERYDIHYAPETESPFGPAIWFVMGKPLERRRTTRKKSGSSDEETQQEKPEATEPKTAQQGMAK